jgi:hypothetical protein
MAVLPFQPLVAERRDSALELGMADTLIARLSGREIIVRPINSVRKYVELDQDPLFVTPRRYGIVFCGGYKLQSAPRSIS